MRLSAESRKAPECRAEPYELPRWSPSPVFRSFRRRCEKTCFRSSFRRSVVGGRLQEGRPTDHGGGEAANRVRALTDLTVGNERGGARALSAAALRGEVQWRGLMATLG